MNAAKKEFLIFYTISYISAAPDRKKLKPCFHNKPSCTDLVFRENVSVRVLKGTIASHFFYQGNQTITIPAYQLIPFFHLTYLIHTTLSGTTSIPKM